MCICVCVWTHKWHGSCWYENMVLHFHHVGLRDQTELKLSDLVLYPLSHVACLDLKLFCNVF